jgi:MOSC domain-containing protein YiiM
MEGGTANLRRVTSIPTVLSVNVGGPRSVAYRGGLVTTAIWKEPVGGRIAVRGVNLAGDDQADRAVHGGVDKAVYSYSREDYDWWESELGHSMQPGTFGENLTVEGLDPKAAVIGERWRAGSALLEISEPRFPCFKLGIRMGDGRFLKRFAEARRPGAYLRIVEEGEVGAGDRIEVEERPRHGVTIGQFNDAYLGDREELVGLLAADEISDDWRSWITERVSP